MGKEGQDQEDVAEGQPVMLNELNLENAQEAEPGVQMPIQGEDVELPVENPPVIVAQANEASLVQSQHQQKVAEETKEEPFLKKSPVKTAITIVVIVLVIIIICLTVFFLFVSPTASVIGRENFIRADNDDMLLYAQGQDLSGVEEQIWSEDIDWQEIMLPNSFINEAAHDPLISQIGYMETVQSKEGCICLPYVEFWNGEENWTIYLGSFDETYLTDNDKEKNVIEFDDGINEFSINYVRPKDEALRTTLPLCMNSMGNSDGTLPTRKVRLRSLQKRIFKLEDEFICGIQYSSLQYFSTECTVEFSFILCKWQEDIIDE